MKELVSICIPAYKQKEHLKKCLESILLQDYENYEMLISDDSPDDVVRDFVHEFLPAGSFQYQHNSPALGSPENWNAAIKLAKGKYIKIMHHDDFFTRKNSLSRMVEEMENAQADLLFCATDVWNINTNSHRHHFISAKQLATIQYKPELLFFNNCIGAPSATLYLRNAGYSFNRHYKWLVDVEFYIQFLINNKNITALNEALICTIDGAQGQITGQIISDQTTQIKEHVLLYLALKSANEAHANYSSFFDRLFFYYNINSLEKLLEIVPEAASEKEYFSAIINQLHKFRRLKWLKKRFFESRYNNYIFNLQEFL